MIKLDYSQHKCPYPVVETRKQILAHPGEQLEVMVGDQAGRDNVTRLAEKMGYQPSAETVGNGFRLTLSPSGEHTEETRQTLPQSASPASGKTVIYCGSDRMGTGDDGFGKVLMRNFLGTLLEMTPLPDTVLFVNSGINLTTTGSEVLETLQKLVDQGVDIATCGLCLEFYEKKERLEVGRVTNMYEMVETQCQAARVISP